MPDAIYERDNPEPVPLAIERMAMHLACWPNLPAAPVTRWNGVAHVVKVDMRDLAADEPSEAAPVPSWAELQQQHAAALG